MKPASRFLNWYNDSVACAILKRLPASSLLLLRLMSIPAPITQEAPYQLALEGMVVTMLVGILPHELTQPQPIELSVWVTFPPLGRVEEQLDRCHDYRPLLAFVEALSTQRYALLETLGEQLAAFCFKTWPTALGCKVNVAKLTLLQGAKVGITREWHINPILSSSPSPDETAVSLPTLKNKVSHNFTVKE